MPEYLDYDFNSADIYFFKVNNGNTRIRSEIFLKLRLKTLERSHWCRYSVFICWLCADFIYWFNASVVDIDEVNTGWGCLKIKFDPDFLTHQYWWQIVTISKEPNQQTPAKFKTMTFRTKWMSQICKCFLYLDSSPRFTIALPKLISLTNL